jgi:glutamate/tyrosine decarboxylase-like PLP-dependent enzyme
MHLEKRSLKHLQRALDELEAGFKHLESDLDEVSGNEIADVLIEVARRMQNNYPYFHPLYAGQMLKPPHIIARLAYMLSMWINPNNHALDGGRASSQMETEAVAELAFMFGWKQHLGHLCSGGTMANLEALWIAGRLKPDETIVASQQAHYTHQRITDVLKLPFASIPCDEFGRMDMTALADKCSKQSIGTVVATIGTTATGCVDPLQDILKLQEQYSFRIHADAAYGGYFILTDTLADETRRSYDLLHTVDSIVIDPHKHGLQPYGAGCILFKDPTVGRFYKHDSPYTYFTSDELHLGEISLECSRPGSAAVALWATQRLFPLKKNGAFAQNLVNCRSAALELYHRLEQDSRFLTVFPPELDIVIWAPLGKHATEISNRSVELFNNAAKADLHLSTLNFPASILAPHWPDVHFDSDTVICLRSCLMKEAHLKWLDKIWEKLDQIAG